MDASLIVAREALIDEVDLSADGATVVYSRRTTEAGENVRRLWSVPFAGGRPRQLTHGRHVDHTARISPDGRQVAFLSDRETDADQVWIVSLDGGEPRRLTSFARGAVALAWREDSRALAVAAHDDRSPLLAGERAGRTPTARVLTRIDWRDDDTYGLLMWPVHVHLVPLRGRSRRLTAGDWSASAPGFLQDDRVAFLADLGADRDRAPNPQLYAVPESGGEPVRVVEQPGPVLAWTLDSGEILCLAHGEQRPGDADPSLVRAADGAIVGGDRDSFCAAVSGAAHVVHRSGREIVALRGGAVLATVAAADAIAAAGDRVAAALVQETGAADVYALEPGWPPRRLTRHGGDWFRRSFSPQVSELRIGEVQTWLLSPAGAGTEPLPTVLAIHGGPVWHWTPATELGPQLLVRAGYRVVLPNIRGSYGFSWEHVDALRGRWGDVDADDCHAVLDHLVEAGLTDPARIGCFGRSYGGFLVNWLLGTSDRFAAGVSECGVSSQVSAFGNSDSGATYNIAAGLGDTLTPAGVELLWRQSPQRHAAAITAPLLILQGEDDLRCPTSDVEQLFVALRWLGRECEYVLYPDGGHTYHRTGRPDRRADRHDRLVGWFERHMPARARAGAGVRRV